MSRPVLPAKALRSAFALPSTLDRPQGTVLEAPMALQCFTQGFYPPLNVHRGAPLGRASQRPQKCRKPVNEAAHRRLMTLGQHSRQVSVVYALVLLLGHNRRPDSAGPALQNLLSLAVESVPSATTTNRTLKIPPTWSFLQACARCQDKIAKPGKYGESRPT